jgi:hypothetical protein
MQHWCKAVLYIHLNFQRGSIGTFSFFNISEEDNWLFWFFEKIKIKESGILVISTKIEINLN